MEGRVVQVHLSCDHLVDVPIESDLYGRFGYIDPADLGLSEALVQELRDYQRRWEETPEVPSDDEDDVDSDAEGEQQAEALGPTDDWTKALLERLRTELGPGYVVRAT